MYEMILFDVDGVLLSEKRCFDTTCLAVWELLYSDQMLGLPEGSFTPAPDEETIGEVRRDVFDGEKILEGLKAQGVNSNWDMVAFLFGFQLQELLKQLFAKQPDFVSRLLTEDLDRETLVWIGESCRRERIKFLPRYGKVTEYLEEMSPDQGDLLGQINGLAQSWSGIQATCFSHGGSLWNLGLEVYQEWYLGGDLYEKQEQKAPLYPEKTGFLKQEIPIVEPSAIRDMLDQLKLSVTLGIGTGRPSLETQMPLEAMEWLPAFDPDRIVTASDVRRAEKSGPDLGPLGKPHPFTYLKAYRGKNFSDADILAIDLPISGGERVLIVGDSVADLLAARQMGCHFAATLTGPSGEKARAKFEELGADYILQDVTEVLSLIRGLGK
ncbi:phosphoglycolate phosphatase-like HAD superfamily hydrolase [Kroppenstedtia sanguinis]|uniref:HAD family hydrolase n=1 Tax=Kroppenstedtia sanguinis TaxID=1380684 RepID=A0ABW4CCZ0_9BACL